MLLLPSILAIALVLGVVPHNILHSILLGFGLSQFDLVDAAIIPHVP